MALGNSLVWLKVLYATTVLAVALNAGTALAHVFERPHKLAMDYETWFPIQSLLYDGWGLKLAFIFGASIIGLLIISIISRPARMAALFALGCVIASDALVFLVWIAPTNAAVESWAGPGILPNWEQLRYNWEWGHTARCILLLIGTVFALFARPAPNR